MNPAKTTSASSVAAEKWSTHATAYGPWILVLKRVGANEYSCAGSASLYYTTFSHLVFMQPDGSELGLYDKASGGQPSVFSCPNDLRDRNGNLITFVYKTGTTQVEQIRDAAGRVTTVTYGTRVTATEADDEIRFVGANWQQRTITVTRMFPRDRLRPGLTLPSSIFPELGTTISGPGRRISRITLPDNRAYEFYYTPHGEVARVVLPTGGAIDYDHGAGLAGAGSIPGVYASGQVLDPLAPIWTPMTGPVPAPPWQPYVYRRLVERREYPDGVGMPAGLVTSFARLETATASYRDPVSGRVNGAAVTTLAYAAVTRSGPGVGTAITEQHYYDGEPYGVPVLSNPPVGPSSGLAVPSPRYRPDPFEGKEYKTETAGLLRVERVYGEEADGAGVVCQENTTWLVGGQVSGRYFRYDRNSNGTQYGATLRFVNETDVYEYDFGSAPAIQTTTANGKTWFVCPSAVPGNAARWRRTDYLLTSAYTAAPVHLRRLANRQQVRTRQGTVVADAKTIYDNQSDSTCALSYSIFDVGIGLQRDASYGTGMSARGNARCVSRWRSGTLGWVTLSSRYDGNGNVTQRTDARGAVTTTVYDALNRPLTKSYSGVTTPNVTYSYAGLRRACGTSMTSSGGRCGRRRGGTSARSSARGTCTRDDADGFAGELLPNGVDQKRGPVGDRDSGAVGTGDQVECSASQPLGDSAGDDLAVPAGVKHLHSGPEHANLLVPNLDRLGRQHVGVDRLARLRLSSYGHGEQAVEARQPDDLIVAAGSQHPM